MFKKLLLALSLLLSSCLGMPELPGIDIPISYDHTFGMTVTEWVEEDMPFPEVCLSRWGKTRLVMAEWDEFEGYCSGIAYSKVQAGKVDKDNTERIILGCTFYRNSIKRQIIVLDSGLAEYKKHEVFAHEVIHTLGECAGISDDSEHVDPQRWKIILVETRRKLYCSGRFDYGDKFPADLYVCDE